MEKNQEKDEGYHVWEATIRCLNCGETFIQSAPDKTKGLAIGNILSKSRLKHGFGELNGQKCSKGGGLSIDDFEVTSSNIVH